MSPLRSTAGAKPLFALLISILCALDFCAASNLFAQMNASTADGRHIIIAYDSSTDMAGERGRRPDRQKLGRLNDYLLKIIYDKIPPAPARTKKLGSETIAGTGYGFDQPLYARGAALTYFTFSDEPRYIFVAKQEFVPSEKFEKMLPSAFKGASGLDVCAKAEAFQNLRLNDLKTYLIIVGSLKQINNAAGSDRKRDCEVRLAGFESNHKAVLSYSQNIENGFFIKIYTLEGSEGPYTFFLTKDEQKLPSVLTFSRSGNQAILDPGFKLLANQNIKRDYRISNVIAVVHKKDKERVEKEVSLGGPLNRNTAPLQGLTLPQSLINDNYAVDLEIGYVIPGAKGNRGQPKLDYFVIRNLAMSFNEKEQSPISQPPLSIVNPDRVNNPTIDTTPEPKPEGNFAAEMESAKPVDTRPGADAQPPRPTAQTPEPKQSKPELVFSCKDPQASDAVVFTKIDSGLEVKVCAIDAKGELPPGFKIQKASLMVGSTAIPLKMTKADLGRPIQTTIDKGQWENLLSSPKSGKIEIVYTAEGQSEPKPVNITVDVAPPPLPKKVEAPADIFMIVTDPAATKPEDVIPAKWNAEGLKINDFYVKPKSDVPPELMAELKDVQFKIAGLVSREGKVNQFPLKLDLEIKHNELGKIAPGKNELEFTFDFKTADSQTPESRTLKVAVDFPKIAGPKFILTLRSDEKKPATVIPAKKIDDAIEVSNLALKTVQPNGLESIGKVQMLSNNKVLHTWEKKAVSKLGYLSSAVIPDAKLDQSSGDIPVSFKVFYNQAGKADEGIAPVPGGVLSVPCGWPWPFSALEGILPCIPFLALLGILVLLPLLILLGLFIMLIGRKKKVPIYFALEALDRSDFDDQTFISPVFELNAGERLALGDGGGSKETWDLNCPNFFVEAKSASSLGKKALYLGETGQLSAMKLMPGREYPITCEGNFEVILKLTEFAKKPAEWNPTPLPKRQVTETAPNQGDIQNGDEFEFT